MKNEFRSDLSTAFFILHIAFFIFYLCVPVTSVVSIPPVSLS